MIQCIYVSTQEKTEILAFFICFYQSKHKTGYNYGIDGASKYYNPFYVTYRGKGSGRNTEVFEVRKYWIFGAWN